MSATAPGPGVGENQRLSATFVLSLLVHAALILGLGFAVEGAAPVLPTLDVILTETSTPLTPKQADFLAQANNQGGGEDERSNRPRETRSGPLSQPEAGTAPAPMRAQSPAPQPLRQERVLQNVRGTQAVARPAQAVEPEPRALPAGPRKVARDAEMARLAAEIHMRSQRYAKRPSRKFVSASTTEYAWAGYLRQWVDRVERVGNLNYPDEARRRQLSGRVVISVAIRRDGSVERADIVRGSGVPLLDASALRIARLAEPYPPLPRTAENPDILHVTRTWLFLPEGALVDD